MSTILVVDCVSYHEWIELFNASGQVVDLGGWALDDEAEAAAEGLDEQEDDTDRSV